VGEERAPGVQRGEKNGEVKGCWGGADDTGRGHRLGENRRARVTLPERGSHRHRSADVEFLFSLQTEATDRPELSAQYVVYLRRQVLRPLARHREGVCRIRSRAKRRG